MQSELLDALRRRRPDIQARWTALLHAEPVNTPLANPAALVHMVDWTLAEIFRGLTQASARRRAGWLEETAGKPHCACGRNPLLAYFAAGEQAMREALVLAQAAAAPLDPAVRDASLHELNLVLQHTARREIEAFCGVCQHRNRDEAAMAPPCVAPAAIS